MAPTKKTKKKEAVAAAAATANADDTAAAASGVTEDVSDDEEEPAEAATAKSKADENSAMESLTDVVEEKQMDEDKMKQAFQALRKQEEADKEAEKKRYVFVLRSHLN